jgi:hypothetical protein
MDCDDDDNELTDITRSQLGQTMQKCRALCKVVNRSQVLTSFVNTERAQLSVSRRLTQDCITRWNSTFCSLQSLILNKQVILNLYTHKHKLSLSSKVNDRLTQCELSSYEWVVLNQVVHVLRPFYEATVLLSGSQYPTIRLCLFTLRTIKDYLEGDDDDESSIATILKGYLLNSLNIYFNESDEQHTFLRVSPKKPGGA